MLLLNYAHPLTEVQMAQLTKLVGETPEIRAIASQTDRTRPLAEVARSLAEAAQLSGEAWQTTPILLNPPALAPLAVALIAELHGRCGHFPPILNIRPVDGAVPPRYELAEIIDLQRIRQNARGLRDTQAA